MSTTCPLDDIPYDKHCFNIDDRYTNHPLWMTEEHFRYQLYRDDAGLLQCKKSKKGEFIKSPRPLFQLSLYQTVTDHNALHKLATFPSNVYSHLLTEAIYQREVYAIRYLVSTWPSPVLCIYDHLPLEDYLDDNYLTLPLEGHDRTSMLDGFMLGLLDLKPESKLKFVDFTKLDKDRKLCRELCRLPILWTTREDRSIEAVHEKLNCKLEISKDKVERYLNRISLIYSNVDMEFKKGNVFGPITILFECKLTMDDVPIGLALYPNTPFKFACSKVWMENIPEIPLTAKHLTKLVDPKLITHLEVEDNNITLGEDNLLALLHGLKKLPNLIALSLPITIDVTVQQDLEVGIQLNKILRHLRWLRRLNLSHCNLAYQLSDILGGLQQPFEYLNLRDCRLADQDLYFLLNWSQLIYLRELNLSRNNLRQLTSMLCQMLQRMCFLTVFSVSYCSLNNSEQRMILRTAIDNCPGLKCLSMQGFTPIPKESITLILNDASSLRSIQRLNVLPEFYAFPGNNDEDRERNKANYVRFCYALLLQKKRLDIEVE
ncbi:unnamed protein product [Owenia fusiformis]|uniref:Leucine-rich repeat-containing protein 14 n=1 Tax=Owenia fusiformis TaxID=6347 RepID=A0A8S4QA60_OWEFU|nr:unnamed protein product [Owenia fusiformis]